MAPPSLAPSDPAITTPVAAPAAEFFYMEQVTTRVRSSSGPMPPMPPPPPPPQPPPLPPPAGLPPVDAPASKAHSLTHVPAWPEGDDATLLRENIRLRREAAVQRREDDVRCEEQEDEEGSMALLGALSSAFQACKLNPGLEVELRQCLAVAHRRRQRGEQLALGGVKHLQSE